MFLATFLIQEAICFLSFYSLPPVQRSIIEPSVLKPTISFREEEEEKTEEEDVSPRRKIRQRWQWAIKQQLLLIRMEKANQNVLSM